MDDYETDDEGPNMALSQTEYDFRDEDRDYIIQQCSVMNDDEDTSPCAVIPEKESIAASSQLEHLVEEFENPCMGLSATQNVSPLQLSAQPKRDNNTETRQRSLVLETTFVSQHDIVEDDPQEEGVVINASNAKNTASESFGSTFDKRDSGSFVNNETSDADLVRQSLTPMAIQESTDEGWISCKKHARNDALPANIATNIVPIMSSTTSSPNEVVGQASGNCHYYDDRQANQITEKIIDNPARVSSDTRTEREISVEEKLRSLRNEITALEKRNAAFAASSKPTRQEEPINEENLMQQEEQEQPHQEKAVQPENVDEIDECSDDNDNNYEDNNYEMSQVSAQVVTSLLNLSSTTAAPINSAIPNQVTDGRYIHTTASCSSAPVANAKSNLLKNVARRENPAPYTDDMESDDDEHWKANIKNMAWKDVWLYLLDEGWTWKFGSGVIARWYLPPKDKVLDLSLKFPGEAEVIKYLQDEYFEKYPDRIVSNKDVQVAGDEDEEWNTQDFLPLVKKTGRPKKTIPMSQESSVSVVEQRMSNADDDYEVGDDGDASEIEEEGVDEFDIPKALYIFTKNGNKEYKSLPSSIKFAQTWKMLEKVGWFWLKGNGLISFIYSRPFEYTTSTCKKAESVINRGLENTDYFISEDAVMKFLCEKIHAEVELHGGNKKRAVSSEPRGAMKTTELNVAPVKKQRKSFEQSRSIVNLLDENDSAASGKVKKQRKESLAKHHEEEDAAANVQKGRKSLEQRSTIFADSEQEDSDEDEEEVGEHWKANIKNMAWKDAWLYLLDEGWTWKFGSGVIARWYLPPKDKVLDQSLKFPGEAEVVDYVYTQYEQKMAAEGKTVNYYGDVLAKIKKQKQQQKLQQKRLQKQQQQEQQRAKSGVSSNNYNGSGDKKRKGLMDSYQRKSGKVLNVNDSNLESPPVLSFSAAKSGSSARTNSSASFVTASSSATKASFGSASIAHLFANFRFVLTAISTTDRFREQLISMIRSNGGEVLNSYPLEEERKVDVKKLIVLAQPSGFRKTTFLLGLASGTVIVHPSWVINCVNQLTNIVQKGNFSSTPKASVVTGIISKALLPFDQYLSPVGAPAFRPYFIFPEEVPSGLDVGLFRGVRLLNLAPSMWEDILRKAGGTIAMDKQSFLDFLDSENTSNKHRSLTILPDFIVMDPFEKLWVQSPKSSSSRFDDSGEVKRRIARSVIRGSQPGLPALVTPDWIAHCLALNMVLNPEENHIFQIHRVDSFEPIPSTDIVYKGQMEKGGERYTANDFVLYDPPSKTSPMKSSAQKASSLRQMPMLGKIVRFNRAGAEEDIKSVVIQPHELMKSGQRSVILPPASCHDTSDSTVEVAVNMLRAKPIIVSSEHVERYEFIRNENEDIYFVTSPEFDFSEDSIDGSQPDDFCPSQDF